MPFPYTRRGLSLDAIAPYIAGYDVGSTPPDFVVLHHSAIPSATWALAPSDKRPWDANESELGELGIYAKRRTQLDNVYRYYAETLGWSAGPHAFIDDRYVWLMSPMNAPGIHAKWGNSFTVAGKMHYSIGIEMIGDFSKTTWHPNQARLAGAFIGALAQRLGTFSIDYLYENQPRPGMTGTGDNQRCLYPERLRWGGISSHRDYNKPACPGAAITEAYYIATLREHAGQPPSVPSCTKWRVRQGIDYAAVRVAANRNAAPAMIGANPVRLNPGSVIASEYQITNWLHIKEPAEWGYSAVSNFERVDDATPVRIV